ncbi:MAG: carboxypeptidase regulatory-like domain-containing protein [Acidobacteriota bacterium]
MSKQTPFHSICAVLLALCLCTAAVPAMAVPAMAQSESSTGQIRGIVTDAQGAAISKATVTATNKNTGLARSSPSNDDGLYAILLLPPGPYNVSAEASGFAASTISDVEVTVGRVRDVNISMGVSGVQEMVSVTAGAIQVQTTRSEADSVLNEKAIENLPINGRRFQDFVTLTPTAQVDPSRGQISLAGQRGINSNVNVDGVDYNQPFFGGIRGGERSNTAFTIPQESIKEFQVVAAGYSAEFGRSTGGVVNAVTKSGTNSFHGSAFFSERPKQASRKTAFFEATAQNLNDTRKNRGLDPVEFVPAPTRHMYGGSFGGPIIKNKAFFFGAYEEQRISIGRQVFFDNLVGVASTSATQEAFNFYQSLQEPYQQTNQARAFLVRGDYEINQNHRFNVRFSRNRTVEENAVSVGNALFPTISSSLSNNGTEIDQLYTIMGQFTSFFTSTMVNEMRAQFAREERPRPANAREPLVTNATIGSFGTVSFLGENVQFDKRFQMADNLTFSKGNHTFKVGGEYNHTFVAQTFGFNQFGTFNLSGSNVPVLLDILSFSPSVTTGVVNRFDCISSITACAGINVTYQRQIGNLEAAYKGDELAFFGQDSWRLRPNLTINYGLRWEEQYNPAAQANNDTLINKVKGFQFPSGQVYDPTIIPDSGGQWGPRLGLAWDPASDGKMVVRGYSGIYFARTPLLLFASPVNNFRTPPGDVTFTLPFNTASLPSSNPLKTCQTIHCQFNLIGIDFNKFTLDKLPVLTPAQLSQIATKLGVSADPFFNAQLISVSPTFKNPKSYQAGLGIEREIFPSFTVGAQFTYVKAVHLERNRELNIPLPTLAATTFRPVYGVSNQSRLRPNPLLQGSLQLRESSAKSLYRALTFSMKVQRKWGQVNAFYTLSKLLADDDNERSAGGVAYQDSYDFSSEYGPSDLDRRHQVVVSPVIFLPKGFDVSSGIRLRSGRPIDARIGSDVNQDTVNNDRPYLGPGVSFERNAFRNLPVYNVDFRAQKRFNLHGENMRLTLSMEMFNIFNLSNIQLSGSAVTNYCAGTQTASSNCGFLGPTNPNFLQTIDRSPTSVRFGQLLLTNTGGEPFQMQFGARFTF